jgi:type I restriction enzyme S subunit
VLRANNIDLGTHLLNLSDLKYISDDVTVSQTKRVRPGSLLICTASGSKSHLGKVAFIDQDYGYAFGGFMGQITPKKEVEERFLFYVLTSSIYKKYIDELSDGVNINNLKYDQLGQFPVIVPPLPEQRRIVAILDEAFEGIATAKANAEKNLQNAREVFEGHLNAVFSQRGEGWMEKGLDEVCLKIQDGAHESPQVLFDTPGNGRFLYITSKNIKDGYLDLNKVAYVNSDFHNRIYSRCQPDVGDILLTKDGSNTGNVSINSIAEPFSLLSSVCLIKTNTNFLLQKFLYFYLRSPIGINKITGSMTGTAIKRIILKTIKKSTITIPSLQAQMAIVSEIDKLNNYTQHLESLYKQKITALDELKQSLLHQAFNGDL